MKRAGSNLWAWGLVVLTLGLVLLGAWLIGSNLGRQRTTVTIGGTAIKATVVDTDAARERGLGGVTRLDDGDGMLFVFDKPGKQPIWMKDMRINLDIVWIGAAKRVTHVERNVAPSTYPKTFRSPVPALYVLEVPAGTAAKASITTDSTATFDLP